MSFLRDSERKTWLLSEGSEIPGEVIEQREQHVREMLKQENSFIRIVEKENRPAGIIILGLQNKPERVLGFLYHIYVDCDFRKMGLASFLLDEAKAWIKEKGGKAMSLNVSCRNPGAIALYEKYGFSASWYSMECDL